MNFFFLPLVYVERSYKSNRLILTEREAVAGQSDFFCNKGGLYSEISRNTFCCIQQQVFTNIQYKTHLIQIRSSFRTGFY